MLRHARPWLAINGRLPANTMAAASGLLADRPRRKKCAIWILRMAAQNRTWGCTRIRGALQNLSYEIGRGTIAKMLKEA